MTEHERNLLTQRIGDETVVVDVTDQRAYSLAPEAATTFAGLPIGDRRAFLRTSALVAAGGIAVVALPAAAAAASTTTTTQPSGQEATVESFDTQLPADMEFGTNGSGGPDAQWSEQGYPIGSMLVTQYQPWRFTGTRFAMGPKMTLSVDVLLIGPGRDIFDLAMWTTTIPTGFSSGTAVFRIETDYGDGGFLQTSSPRIADVPKGHWMRITITSDGTTVTATVVDLTDPTAYSQAPVSVALTDLTGTSAPSGTPGQMYDYGGENSGHYVDNITLTNG